MLKRYKTINTSLNNSTRCAETSTKEGGTKYHKRRDRGETQGGVPAQVRVAEERTDDRGDVGRAREEVEHRRGGDALDVVNGGEVDEQVGDGAQSPQLLTRFVSCRFIAIYASNTHCPAVRFSVV